MKFDWNPKVSEKSKEATEFLEKLCLECSKGWIDILLRLPPPPPNMEWGQNISHKEVDDKVIITISPNLVWIRGTPENPFPPES